MAQPANAAGAELKPKPRTSSRVSNALKTGVVYGGSAVLTAVNNITPHIAGAVDVLVIEQPNGSRKATPFYVRFGKYTALRTRERNVKLYINDELAPFGMHIGMYGQAYFATEAVEGTGAGDEDEQEALLAGMMSPPSGYSSGADEPSLQQDGGEAGATLTAVRQCIDGIKEARNRSSARSAAGARGSRVPVPALGSGAAASVGSPPQCAAVARTVSSPFGTSPAAAPGLEEWSAEGGPGVKHQEQLQRQRQTLSQAQFASALSITDRNESFLSARETLAAPLGDEPASSVFNGISPDSQSRHYPGSQLSLIANQAGETQGQEDEMAAGGDKSSGEVHLGNGLSSLEAVSGGPSPCGWSEDEESPGGVARTANGARRIELSEVEAGSPEAVCSVQGQDAASPSPPESEDHQQCYNHQNYPNHHQQHPTGLQQPLHQQLGFPENAPSAAVAPTSNSAAASGGGAAAVLNRVECVVASPPLLSVAGFDQRCSGPADLQSAGGGGGVRLLMTPTVPAEARTPAAPVPVPSLPVHAAAATHLYGSGRGPYGSAQRASPGAGLLSTAAVADVHVPSCGSGSGPGSHSAVSLLSSSLRGGNFRGIGGSATAASDGRPLGGTERSSSDWLRGKGDVAVETHTSAELPQVPATAAVAAEGCGVCDVSSIRLKDPASIDKHIGPIAAAAVAAVAAAAIARPRPLVESQEEEPNVKLSLTVVFDADVRVRVTVLTLPLQAPMAGHGVSPGSCRGLLGGGSSGRREAVDREVPSVSDGGYLGDGERGSVAVETASGRHHHHHHHHQHHGSHHHHYHYTLGHIHGHGRLRNDHNSLLHSTSAPLPSSAMHATGAAAAAAAAAATGVPAGISTSGATAAPCDAMPAHGIELSLCGGYLKQSMPYSVAIQLFDAHRVSEDIFFSRFSEISHRCTSELMIRLSNGVIFPCQPLSYSLLGLLAFGMWRLPPGTPCWGPEGADVAGGSEAAATSAAAAAAAAMLAAVAQGAAVAASDAPNSGTVGSGAATASAATTPKKGHGATGTTATGSWRRWMFGARRDGARTSATGAGGGGVSTFISGRSPPLTSPLVERPCSVEHRAVSASIDTVQPPLPAPAGVVLPPLPTQPYTAEGPAAAPTACAAADSSASVQPAASGGGSTGGAGPAAARKSNRPQVYNIVTKKSLTPTAEQLAAMPLKHGQNTITYKVGASELRAYVYFLPWRTRIVISDIDGTITKSDVLGHLLPAMGLDWSHPGIAELLTNIRQNNYLIMYLSSRSISQANITRDFINTLVQGEHRMPLGPVIISPHGLLPSLYREMILRRPHEFKIATLQDIRALFPPDWNPFYGGFGNRDTDEISYREVGVQPSRIFIINPRGELRQPMDSSPREDPSVNAAIVSAATAGTGPANASRVLRQQDAAAPSDGRSTAELPADAVTLTVSSPSAAAPTAGVALQSAPALSSATVTVTTREVFSSRSLGATGGPVGRRVTASTVSTTIATVSAQLSTLSAINELVHDIFPPLRDERRFMLMMEGDVGSRSGARAGSQRDHEDVKVLEEAQADEDEGMATREAEGVTELQGEDKEGGNVNDDDSNHDDDDDDDDDDEDGNGNGATSTSTAGGNAAAPGALQILLVGEAAASAATRERCTGGPDMAEVAAVAHQTKVPLPFVNPGEAPVLNGGPGSTSSATSMATVPPTPTPRTAANPDDSGTAANQQNAPVGATNGSGHNSSEGSGGGDVMAERSGPAMPASAQVDSSMSSHSAGVCPSSVGTRSILCAEAAEAGTRSTTDSSPSTAAATTVATAASGARSGAGSSGAAVVAGCSSCSGLGSSGSAPGGPVVEEVVAQAVPQPA